MKINFILITVCIIFTTLELSARNIDNDKINDIMKGQSYYRFQTGDSRKIEGSYIGYDENDMSQMGVIVGKEDIYEDITIIMTVAREKGQYRILDIEIPDIEEIKDGEKRKRLSDIISEYEGLTVYAPESGDFAVDALSGATRFVKKGHKTFDSLFRELVEEMEGAPDGEKIFLK